MTRRLVIAIDCDDVLVPTGVSQIAFYNNKYNATVGEKEFYESATMDVWGTDDDQLAIDRVAEHTLSDDFADVPPMEDAVDAIHRLSKQHELHLVTGRPSVIEAATMRLLNRYFKDCFTSVEHTNYYTYSWNKDAKKRSKAEVCRSLGADLFIDDYIVHVRDVIDSGVCEVILFGDYEWSVLGEKDKRVARCSNWKQTEEEINHFANR